MTTKDEFLFFKDKQQCFVNDISQTDERNQYSNLNLNQTYKLPNVIPVELKSSSHIKKDRSFKLSNLQVLDYGSGKVKTLVNYFESMKLNDAEEEPVKQWKKGVSLSTTNKSTLSLR